MSSLKRDSNYSTDSTDSTESVEINWTEYIINNRYIILNKIGKGSYCTVWTTYDINLKKIFALKIYNEDDMEDAENEIKVLDIIKSFNLENVILYNNSFNYELGDDVYIMQVINLCGYSLNFILKLFKDDFLINSDLYNKYVNFIYDSYIKVHNLLHNLHEHGYAHTDIKPENILIDIPVLENKLYLDKILNIHSNLEKKGKNKNLIKLLHNECKTIVDSNKIDENDIKMYLKEFNYSIKVSDFGTSLKMGDETIYKKHTQYYKSPKILLKFPLDNTYDYWSLSCTLYELLICDILFNPYDSDLEDKYGENDDRNLMYLIISNLGIPDKKILNESSVSDIYFNSLYNGPRGYLELKYIDFIGNLINKSNLITLESVRLKYIELVNIITNYLSYSYLFNY